MFLHAKYGYNDTIQCIHYALLLKNAGVRIFVEVQALLGDFLSHCNYIDSRISIKKPLPKFDVKIFIINLAHIFKTTQKTIPNTIPYFELA